jgi:hypothetical protein
MRLEPDCGVTNICNTSFAHWQRWLEPDNRCLVPFTSFSEYDTIKGKKVPVWFATDESRPLLAFAGIWTNWTSVRKAREGEITVDLFGLAKQIRRRCPPLGEVGRDDASLHDGAWRPHGDRLNVPPHHHEAPSCEASRGCPGSERVC